MSLSDARPRVLLVDDSEIACEAVKNALEPEFEVTTLNSPFGFIKTTRAFRPAVILLDVGLGAVNGTGLAKLVEGHAPAYCVVLLYSSRSTDQLEEDVRTSAAHGYISKSTTGAALRAAIRRWIPAVR